MEAVFYAFLHAIILREEFEGKVLRVKIEVGLASERLVTKVNVFFVLFRPGGAFLVKVL